MNKTNDVKIINKSAILQTIYKYKSITKSSIASELKLTIVTVNNLVSELCEAGICVENGYVSNGGRKAALYRINQDYGYIISLRLTRTGLIAGIYDLDLNCIESQTMHCDIADVMGSINQMKTILLSMIGKVNGANILGVGISVPGRASVNGTIINIPDYPQWNSVQLSTILSESIRVPIMVDNDTNALLLSAKWNGLAGNCKSFVYLNTDDGLGAGFMLKNNVFYGSNNQGCEIGHITIDPNGPVCKCGNTGCLQAYISNSQIIDQINKTRGGQITNIEQAIELYRNGDETAIESFSRATSYIALAIRNIIMFFDPEMIVLQNKWLNSMPEFFSMIQNTVFKSKTDRNDLPLRQKLSILLNRDAHAIDAASACIVFNNFLQNFSE